MTSKKPGRPKKDPAAFPDDIPPVKAKRGHLTPEEKSEIERRLREGDGVYLLAKDFGVSEATIYLIKTRLRQEGRLPHDETS